MKIDKDKIIIEIMAKIGETEINFEDFINLKTGSLIKLDRKVSNFFDIYANNVSIGVGKIIVTNNNNVGLILINKK